MIIKQSIVTTLTNIDPLVMLRAGFPEQPGCIEKPKSYIPDMFLHNFLCYGMI